MIILTQIRGVDFKIPLTRGQTCLLKNGIFTVLQNFCSYAEHANIAYFAILCRRVLQQVLAAHFHRLTHQQHRIKPTKMS